MDISVLASRQKKIRQWCEFLTIPNIPAELSQALNSKISAFRQILIEACNNPSKYSNADEELKVRALEKELEAINEQIRLTVPITLARHK